MAGQLYDDLVGPRRVKRLKCGANGVVQARTLDRIEARVEIFLEQNMAEAVDR